MIFDGLNLEIFPTVYEPAEDSFLLAKYAKQVRGKILDLGCGSGIQALVNAKYNPENKVYGVDINLEAVRNSDHNKMLNRIRNVKFQSGNLFNNFREGKDFFDGIIFNPPYLPTTQEEKLEDELNYAFDGGLDGRELVEVFLEQFDRYLSQEGVMIMLHSSLNDLKKTEARLRAKGFSVQHLEEEKFFFEKITVLRVNKNLPGSRGRGAESF